MILQSFKSQVQSPMTQPENAIAMQVLKQNKYKSLFNFIYKNLMTTTSIFNNSWFNSYCRKKTAK